MRPASVLFEAETRDEICGGECRALEIRLHEIAPQFLESGRLRIVGDTDSDHGKPQLVGEFDELLQDAFGLCAADQAIGSRDIDLDFLEGQGCKPEQG